VPVKILSMTPGKKKGRSLTAVADDDEFAQSHTSDFNRRRQEITAEGRDGIILITAR